MGTVFPMGCIRLAAKDENRLAKTKNTGGGSGVLASLLFSMLAVSLFAWGTSYKLSLYKNTATINLTPAKLCTLSSDAAKSEFDRAIDGHEVVLGGLLLSLLLIASRIAPLTEEQLSRETIVANLAPLKAAPILRLRPPPATVTSLFR